MLETILPFFHSYLGAFFFTLIYTIFVILLFPGSWISMTAGFLYGSLIGSCLVFVGAFIGAQVSFFLGKKFFRKKLKARILKYPKLMSVEKALNKEGLKLVFLTRLSPIFPFSITNYFYSLTDLSFRDYSISLIGILPGTILYCSLGELADDVSKFSETLQANRDLFSLSLSFLGLISTIILVFIIIRVSNKALQDVDSKL